MSDSFIQNPTETLDEKRVWSQACDHLKLKLSPPVYNTWIVTNPLTKLQKQSEDEFLATITSPTAFHSSNVKKNLHAQIKDSLEKVTQKKINLEYEVGDMFKPALQKIKKNVVKTPEITPQNNLQNGLSNPDSLFSQQTILISQSQQSSFQSQRAGLRKDYTFDNFAVSSTNEMAHAAALTVSRQPGTAYNPLFLYGDVGVGKTHLMNAIGVNLLQDNPQAKVIYVTGETFTNEIVAAIRNKKALHFKHKYRSCNLLLIDDIQFIAGKNAVQEEFFHTFNTLVGQNSQIVLSSDRPPHEISLLEDRLRSRFEAGLMIDIQQPTFELRTAILLIKSKTYNINIPMNLAQLIASKVESVRKIEGIIKAIKSEVDLKNAILNQDLIERILSTSSGHQSLERILRVNPQEIIKTVANHYHIKQNTLKGKSRVKQVANSRQIAMYLMKNRLKISYSEIGSWFSNRDHSTVMHSVAKIEESLKTNSSLQQDIAAIETSLTALSR